MNRHIFYVVIVLVVALAGCGRQLPDETPAPAVSSSSSSSSEAQEEPSASSDSDTTETTPEASASEDEVDAVVEAEDEVPSDPLVASVRGGNAANGEALFAQINSTGFACSSCHNALTTDRLVGPGLWGLPTQTDERVPGAFPEHYIYNSIVNPNEYVVADYPENLMPQNYSEVFSEQEIYDMSAYLMTLQETPAVAAVQDEVPADVEEASDTDAPADAVAQDGPTQTPVVIIVTATPSAPTEAVAVADNSEENMEMDAPAVTATPAPIVFLAQSGIVSYGEELFNAEIESGSTCADCHTIDGSENPDGPTLLGIPNTASATAPDMPAEAYIYDAIVNTGFHTEDYINVYGLSELGDMVAYLMTLEGDPEVIAAQAAEAEAAALAVIESGVAEADAANGEELFALITDTGFACSSCHLVDSTDRLVGPGLLGIPQTAAGRVEGQSALFYLHLSIVNPNDYIVAEYPENLMPATYSEVFTEEEIYDILAYLLTLEE